MGQKIKTHLIVKDTDDEYHTKWVGFLRDIKDPVMRNGLPQFYIISSAGRLEVPTFNIQDVEKAAKRFTYCKGRGALTTDKAYIYIEAKPKDVLLGIVHHNHIRHYAPMYDDPDDLRGTQWEYLVDRAMRNKK